MGWFVAQLIKTILDIWLTKSFHPERLTGSGGMPSSHSATVCALATSVFLINGVGSFEFAMAVFFAIVVMHDASGVRMETGKQAAILNEMMETFSKMYENAKFEQSLKELVGHTPVQVFVGAILGIAIGFAVNSFY